MGLLAADSCVSVLLFSGSVFTLVSNLISSFVSGSCACSEDSVLVTPALNLGLKPVGFGAEFVVSSVFSSDADVLAATSGALVTPALNLGLNPVGLLAAGSCVSVLLFSGSAFTLVSNLISSFVSGSCACSEDSVLVTPALNLGLKPVGFGAEFVVSSVFSSDADVLAATSGALVTPALNLGLNPVGIESGVDSAKSVISFLDVALTSSSTAVGGALNRGLKPAGFAV